MRKTIWGSGLALTVLLLAGCAAPAPDAEKPPAATPSASPIVEAEPTATETELSIPERITKVEIPSGLSAEEFAKTLFERETEWANAGASDDLVTRSVEANESWEVFLPKVAADNTLVYAPALFGPDWQDRPDVAEYVGKMEAMNLGVLEIYVSTAWNANEHPENVEAYRYWREPAEPQLVSEEGSERHFQFKVMNYNNSDKNLADDGVVDKDNGKIYMRLGTQTTDGIERIMSISEYITY